MCLILIMRQLERRHLACICMGQWVDCTMFCVIECVYKCLYTTVCVCVCVCACSCVCVCVCVLCSDDKMLYIFQTYLCWCRVCLFSHAECLVPSPSCFCEITITSGHSRRRVR